MAIQMAFLFPVIASEFKQIELIDFRSNKVVNLSMFNESKPIYIKLWATWCKPCMEQMPHFQRIQEKYGDKINIFAVNININENMKYIDDVVTKKWINNACSFRQRRQVK